LGDESAMCGVRAGTRVHRVAVIRSRHRVAVNFVRSDSSSPRKRGPSVFDSPAPLRRPGEGRGPSRSLQCARQRAAPSGAWSPLHGRGASHFLCLAKESNQRKARPRSRPLRGCPALLRPAGRRPNSHDRAARATCFGQRAPETPAALALLGVFEGRQDNGSPLSLTLSPSGERGSFTDLAFDLALDLPALEDAEQRRAGRGCRSHTVRSTWRGEAAIVRVCATAGLTEQHREPLQAASSWERLSLVTFFGKTKKVTGPAAVERVVPQSAPCATRSAEQPSEDAKATTLDSRLRGNDTSLRSSRSPSEASLRDTRGTSASPC
jgi:hypothetical protein